MYDTGCPPYTLLRETTQRISAAHAACKVESRHAAARTSMILARCARPCRTGEPAGNMDSRCMTSLAVIDSTRNQHYLTARHGVHLAPAYIVYMHSFSGTHPCKDCRPNLVPQLRLLRLQPCIAGERACEVTPTLCLHAHFNTSKTWEQALPGPSF